MTLCLLGRPQSEVLRTRAEELEFGRLSFHHRGEVAPAVAELRGEQPGQAVEVPLAVTVVDVRAVAADDHDLVARRASSGADGHRSNGPGRLSELPPPYPAERIELAATASVPWRRLGRSHG
jgi:hypothetical protein